MAFREPSEVGTCVVCGELVVRPVWPNEWERIQRTRALCSVACGRVYDADRHWLPSRAPASVSEDEASRLIAAARDRMRAGTDARPVARELLAAGVPPWMVKNVVVSAAARARTYERWAGAMAVFTLGHWRAAASGERHDPGSGGDALADVETWLVRFAAK